MKDFRTKHTNIVASYRKAMKGLDKDIKRDFVKSLEKPGQYRIDTGITDRIFLEGDGEGNFWFADKLVIINPEEFQFAVIGTMSNNYEVHKTYDWDDPVLDEELKFQIHNKIRENKRRERR